MLAAEPTRADIDDQRTVRFLRGKQHDIELVQRRRARASEDESVRSIIELHEGPLEGEKLTNKAMAMFLRKQKQHQPGLRIGKMRRAELIAKIRAFASATPQIETPGDGDEEDEEAEDAADQRLLSAFPIRPCSCLRVVQKRNFRTATGM